MTLLTALRTAFLLCLGIHLLSPNDPCRIVGGVSSIILAIFVLLGRF